jgi:signal transduction histidine kinase
MSLRRRLLLVVGLAALALGAAALAVFDVLRTTESARLKSSASQLETATSALASAFAAGHSPSLRAADRPFLEDCSRRVVAALTDAQAGFCSFDGEVFVQMASRVRDEPKHRPKPLPPDQRAALVATCQAARSQALVREQIAHPHDVVVIATRRLAVDGAGWVLTHVPLRSSEEQSHWQIELALLSLATLLLIAVALGAVAAVTRGVRGLEESLARLQVDLQAPLTAADTGEFAQLTAGVQRMAGSLAASQERERDLLRDLAHRERLAGLGRVVAGVAHEIRNPLTGIKLKLDVLARRRETDQSARGEIRACLDEVERLDRVVQALLSYARRAPQRKTLQLGSLLDERMRLLQHAAAQRALTLRREGDAQVLADRDALSRAVDNLLRNAIEASPSQAEILARVEAGATEVRLEIVDWGEGVASEREAALFEPFFTTKPGGTGLGLWLSRCLIEAHAGSLEYRRVDQTSVFRVTLPLEFPHES